MSATQSIRDGSVWRQTLKTSYDATWNIVYNPSEQEAAIIRLTVHEFPCTDVAGVVDPLHPDIIKLQEELQRRGLEFNIWIFCSDDYTRSGCLNLNTGAFSLR